MAFSFNPKEAVTFIAKSIAISYALANGMSQEQAEIAGGLVAGTLNGFNYKSNPKPISHQLSEAISRSVKDVMLQNPEYEIPDDCVAPLTETFSFDNAIRYLKSTDPVNDVCEAIVLACSQSQNCDVTSLPIEDISNKFLQQIYAVILNNHELSTLLAMVYAEETNRKVDHLIPLLKTCVNEGSVLTDTPEDIARSSEKSAQKYAGFFLAELFSEIGRSDSLHLCDVYVDPDIADSSGCHYTSFEDAYHVWQHEETILLEGEAGLGKSSLLMKIADGYLKGQLFQGNTLFFIQGKDIRHSQGEPVDDLLKSLGLKSIESLDNTVVFLDAYDEISYAASSPEKNQEYLRKLMQSAEGFSLVITVRADYIKTFNGPRLRLCGFDAKQRIVFLNKYNSLRRAEDRLSADYIASLTRDDSFYEDDINELLSIPMLLYMIVVNRIDISTIADKYDLYELVFSHDGRGSMLSRGNEQKRISKKIWSDSYSLALCIAKTMLFTNDPFIPENKILSIIDSMDSPKETKQMLKNRFGVEIFLSGNNSSIFTFFHRSIYEYFAAKGICNELKNMLERYIHKEIAVSTVIESINKIFPADYYSENIFYYIMYALNKGVIVDILSIRDNIRNVVSLFNQVLTSRLCIGGDKSIPYLKRLKNLYLWVFNSFSVMFGMLEVDGDPHWAHVDFYTLQSILKLKEPEETLIVSHYNLQNTSFYCLDLGSVYFVDNDLSGSFFKGAICRDITLIGQSLKHINFHSADFWNGNYSGCVFDNSDLRFADFRGANLTNVSFRNADLRCGSFSGANLTGAIFDGAHLYLEDFSNAIVDEGALKAANTHNYEADDPNDDILSIYPLGNNL